MVKLQYDQNKQYKLTLPKAIVEAKGWGKGDTVVFKDHSATSFIVEKI